MALWPVVWPRQCNPLFLPVFVESFDDYPLKHPFRDGEQRPNDRHSLKKSASSMISRCNISSITSSNVITPTVAKTGSTLSSSLCSSWTKAMCQRAKRISRQKGFTSRCRTYIWEILASSCTKNRSFSCNRTDLAERFPLSFISSPSNLPTHVEFHQILHGQMVLFRCNQCEIPQFDDSNHIRSRTNDQRRLDFDSTDFSLE